MRKSVSSLTFALMILLAAATALAGHPGSNVATDKSPKPEDLDFSPSRESFDCTARDTLDISAGFLAEIPDSTTASQSNLDGYACRNWNEQGPENIYRLDIQDELELFASLRNFEDPTGLPDEDLDIFLLSDCDTDSCLVGANLEFSIELAPGTYYLIVDGYGTSNPAEGHFTLVLEGKVLGLPDQICDPGGSTPVSPGTEAITEIGNVFPQPNLIQNYDCSNIVERGGELWYEVTVEAHHEFEVEITSLAETLDAAIWLFDGCGPSALCLDFADDKLSGESEVLLHANDTDDTQIVYVGIDSYRPADTEPLGEVTVVFTGTSNVPTVKRSMGGVRALFR